MNAFSFFPKDH